MASKEQQSKAKLPPPPALRVIRLSLPLFFSPIHSRRGKNTTTSAAAVANNTKDNEQTGKKEEKEEEVVVVDVKFSEEAAWLPISLVS